MKDKVCVYVCESVCCEVRARKNVGVVLLCSVTVVPHACVFARSCKSLRSMNV